MSYSGKYITPIYDRTSADVGYARENPTEMSKGAYNYIDLNRIENNTRYVADDMFNRGITDQPINLNSKYDWNESDVPTSSDMNRILNNILLLRSLSIENLEWVPFPTAGQINYIAANAIERDLEYMRVQPKPEPDKFYLKVENGSGSGYYIEDTIVKINANVPPIDMIFDKWSGDPEDIKNVDNVHASSTTFKMWHKDATIKANYVGAVPHTLTVKGGSGSGTYRNGEIIQIVADDAPLGKVFHHWEGEYAESNIVNWKASTTSITMPNTDCTITAVYVHPGEHQLVVYNGTGGGYYDYGEKVFISAEDKGRKYTFSHWSGDTVYLEDSKSESTTVNMPDARVVVQANYTYTPDKYTLTVVNGSGSGTYNETENVSIVADVPPEGTGFYAWMTNDAGYIRDEMSPSTIFGMRYEDATVKAVFNPLRTITMNNHSNTGITKTESAVQGRYYTVDTAEIVGDSIFNYWLEGSEKIGPRFFQILVGDTDRVFDAVYRARKTYKLTVNNGTGTGDYLERATVRITANAAPEGKRFSRWNTSSEIYSIDNRYSSTTIVTVGYGNCNVTAVYEDIPVDPVRVYHKLTVNNGTGSGTYYEGQSVRINANSAPSGYRFSHWEGDTDRLSSPTASSTYYYMGTSDGTVTAVYSLLPDWTLTVNNGTGSGAYKQGASPTIIANEAQDGYRFLTWTGDIDRVENVMASTTRIVGISTNTTVTATYFIPERPDYYLLTVNQGYGGGKQAAGSRVDIHANSPLDGYEFYKWIGDTETIDDIRSAETTLLMPAYATTITATYKLIGTEDVYTLTVNYGEGSGDYEEFEEVPIKANPPSNGFEFDKWLGDTANVKNIHSPETTVIIGTEDITITASYKEMEKYTLTVGYGLGSGEYYKGQEVKIIANLVDTDNVHYIFKQWIGEVDTIEDIRSKETILIMKEKDMTIAAEYDVYYRLTIGNGSGSGYYMKGATIQIKANEPEQGQTFSRWTGDTSVLSYVYNPNSTVTMPDSVVELTAVYRTYGEENSIGTINRALEESNILSSDDITILSGVLDVGFILTDSKGHIYVCTSKTNENYTFERKTKIH